MKAKVDPYKSVTFRDTRYHQGDEIEFSNMAEIEAIAESVTVLNDDHNENEEA